MYLESADVDILVLREEGNFRTRRKLPIFDVRPLPCHMPVSTIYLTLAGTLSVLSLRYPCPGDSGHIPWSRLVVFNILDTRGCSPDQHGSPRIVNDIYCAARAVLPVRRVFVQITHPDLTRVANWDNTTGLEAKASH